MRTLIAFVMVLSYSRYVFVRFYLDAPMNNSLRGHAKASPVGSLYLASDH